MRTMLPTRPVHYIRYAAFTLLMAASFVSSAFAQEYLTLPIDDKANANRSVALQCLKDPATYADPASKAKFDDFFRNYFLPSLTRTEPDKLGEVGRRRGDLFKDFLGKATNPAAQQDLINMTFEVMGKIVTAKEPPCHPAARYNAILIIGALDEQPAVGQQPPKPLSKATGPLTKIVDSATADASPFPPSVILGAIIGLERHAQYKQSLAPDAVAAMSAALLKLVTHDQPIQEMDRDAYAWLRLRAASALTRIGSVGDKNAAHNAIIKLASSGKSIDDRCEAAALLERLEYKDVKLDDAGTADPLFTLTRDVAAAEDQRAKDFQDQYSGTGTAPSSFPGEPGGLSSSATVEIYPRRQSLTRIKDLSTALKKVKPSLPEETQKKITAIEDALKPAIAALGSKDTVPLTLAETMRNTADAINRAVPPPEKPGADKAKEEPKF